MQNLFFPEIKERFGFGCMRLPMIGSEVDKAQFSDMVDAFLARASLRSVSVSSPATRARAFSSSISSPTRTFRRRRISVRSLNSSSHGAGWSISIFI